MNQSLKSLFITLYPVLCVLGLYLSWDQFVHQYIWAGLGLLLISMTMLGFLAKLFLTFTPRTTKDLTRYTIQVGVGILLLSYALLTGQGEKIGAFGFVLAIGWLLYIRWYSTFNKRDSTLLRKGQRLPRLLFENEDGSVVDSESFKGYKSILIFYRGNWCPLCMAQIKEIANTYKTLKAKGIETILISPQPHSQTRKLAKKHNVDFRFLVDKDNAVATQLEIAVKNGLPTGMQLLGYDSDTVLPTVILINEHSVIIHSDITENYRVRPEPDDLMTYFSDEYTAYVGSG